MPIEATVRVLVTVRGSGPNEDALRAVWSLLDSQTLEMTGLYVEDEDLLRAAALPCFREISFAGTESALDASRLARDMDSEAAAARHAFEALAGRLAGEHRRLLHRFLVTRGRIAEELVRAAAESDFVLMTRAPGGFGLRHRIGRELARLVQQPKHVLLVNEPWASGSSIVVLQGSDLALDHAVRLARAQHLRLVVAIPIAAPPPDRLPANASVRQLTRWDEAAFAELCLREDARLLILPELEGLDWAELLISLMDKLPCSVLKLADRPRQPP